MGVNRCSLKTRLDRITTQLFSGSEEAVQQETEAEWQWWFLLLFPSGGKIPPRPKTRHVTLEVLVCG